MDANYPRLMAAYNRWMNERLYAACDRLDDTTRHADLGAFFKSIHATLDHLLWGDTAWFNRLQQQPVELPPLGTLLCPDWDDLKAARASLDEQLVEWADGLTESWLAQQFSFTSRLYQREFTQPRWVFVTHFFNHQTHHRGQLTTLLAQLDIDFGITDLPMLPELADPDWLTH
ncbi:DinB family protein [Chitiniphilus purpureus]|uniref:DinB family protein n=1 Tax=Chitiniphilus purpureus TaxID=2981137 RepID=A0ABY6DS21_9NEIS|nr:DinB family protein [Chitiniphilus sp. CD1]UXY17028.1 DinB family protein [Chitiniphilus sp. CD1]